MAPLDWPKTRGCAKEFLEVPHLDRGVCGSHKPIVLGTEGESIDGAAGIKGVEVLTLLLTSLIRPLSVVNLRPQLKSVP